MFGLRKPKSLPLLLGLHLLNSVATVFDLISLPIWGPYVLWVWTRLPRVKYRRQRLQLCYPTQQQVGFASTKQPSGFVWDLMQDKSRDSLSRVLSFTNQRFAWKQCLGVRNRVFQCGMTKVKGVFLRIYHKEDYSWRTFEDVESEASLFGRGLTSLVSVRSARGNVGFISENRAECMVILQGLWKQSLIGVLINHWELDVLEVVEGLKKAEVTVVIISGTWLDFAQKVVDKLEKIHTVILLDQDCDFKGFKYAKSYLYEEILKAGENSGRFDLDLTFPSLTALVMFTGDTTDRKAVSLSHKNLLTALIAYDEGLKIRDDDVLMTYVSLGYLYELLVELVCLLNGASIGYSNVFTATKEGPALEPKSLCDSELLEPTVMTSHPAFLSTYHKEFYYNLSTTCFAKQLLKYFFYNYKQRWNSKGYPCPIVDRIIGNPNFLGGKVRVIIVGGGVENQRELQTILNIPIQQLYGATESCFVGCIQEVGDLDVGVEVLGPPSIGCHMQLFSWEKMGISVRDKPHPGGLMLISGDCVSEGYYGSDHTKTDVYFTEVDMQGRRWFITGDVCRVFKNKGVVKFLGVQLSEKEERD